MLSGKCNNSYVVLFINTFTVFLKEMIAMITKLLHFLFDRELSKVVWNGPDMVRASRLQFLHFIVTHSTVRILKENF